MTRSTLKWRTILVLCSRDKVRLASDLIKHLRPPSTNVRSNVALFCSGWEGPARRRYAYNTPTLTGTGIETYAPISPANSS
jgi:hypothetical protein